MQIGFVTHNTSSSCGESIRVIAIRNFFKKMHIPFRDIELDFNSLGINHRSLNISSLPFIREGINILLKKILLKRRYSITKNLNILNKIRQLTAIIENASKEIVRHSNGIKLFHAETQVPAYICSQVKEKIGIPYIFDMRGLLVEERKAFGEPDDLINYYFEIEKEAIKNASTVIVVSSTMKDYVISQYRYPAEKIVVIQNASYVYPVKARYEKPIKIIYGGGLSYFERVEDFLKTAEILDSKEFQFYLVGDGMLRNNLIDYINSKYLNINYLGRKKHQDSLNILQDMQIGFAPSTKDIVRRVASPLKIFDYASCGLPIITVNVGEWSDLVREYDCGIVTENSSPKEFVEAIEQLKDRGVWKRKSDNGRLMIEKEYNWDKALQPLLNICSKEQS